MSFTTIGTIGAVILKINVTTSAPSAPTSISATLLTVNSASISFTAPSNTNVTSYTVTSNPGSIVKTGSSSPIIVTGLTSGTAYTFTVTATNQIGTSSPSTVSNSITTSVPSAPTITSVTALTASTASISFSAPSGTVTSYDIISNPATTTQNTTSTSYTFTGLALGTTYTFSVTAKNDAGSSSASTASNSITMTATSAIPNYSGYTYNAAPTHNWIVTGQSNSAMNGTYWSNESTAYVGRGDRYGSHLAFNGVTTYSGVATSLVPIKYYYFQSRTNYNSSGTSANFTASISGINYTGEWFTITAPYSFVLNSYSLLAGDGIPTRWVLAGSNDDTNGQSVTLISNAYFRSTATWTYIDSRTGQNPTSITNYSTSSNTTSYSSYMLLVTNVSTSNTLTASVTNLTLYY
uniref:Fibronectin type-III domain-containing protein n=1 Tax=viral metagenome TaxID=1070528 RepID=A0A6C0D3S7_9ZZZZ